jgi:uncharacterized membrane protein YhaH (DUF805 family)
MTFGQAIVSCLKNYARFSGRAARSEYWYWVLFVTLARVVTRLLDATLIHGTQTSANPFGGIVSLVILIPSLAVAVRRLHDVNRSGWWLLLYFTIIGIFYPLLVWKCTKGTDGPNRYGPDPFGIGAKAVDVFS